MKLSDLTIKGTPVLATQEDVRQLQDVLGSRLPAGYREFMLALGEGVLGGAYVRVYPPWRIERELHAWRDRLREYWFWGGLAQKRALACVLVGDTLDGDELIFHPEAPDDIWVLPRHSEQALCIGRGLWDALEWLCSSGVLTEPFPARGLEPFDSRRSEGAA